MAQAAADKTPLDEIAAQVRAHFLANKPEPASFPAMASRVVEVAEQADVDAGKLAHLIERDPAICTAVLAMANSAGQRGVTAIGSIREAVARLGLKNVANVALGIACRSLFDMELRAQQQLFAPHWERLFHAAMTEAFSCAFVAMSLGGKGSEGIFLLGLLHDLGKSLGLRSLATLMVGGQMAPLTSDADLEEVLLMNNAEFGAVALETFAMPEHICAAVRDQYADAIPEGHSDLHVLRLVANLNLLRMETLETERPLRHVELSARALGLTQARLIAIAQQISEHSAQVGALFSTSDAADESGFIDFVRRAVAEMAELPK